MQSLRQIQDENIIGARNKAPRGNLLRKPLRGVENRVANLPVKGTLKEKSVVHKANDCGNDLKPIKSIRSRTRSQTKREAFNNVDELKKSLPSIESHSTKQLPPGVENIDADDTENHLLVSIYINDIYCYLRNLEAIYPIRKYHLQLQPDITGKMRAILVDWLIQVHLKFSLLQETLYMAVSILDRYLQVEKVKRQELQLVGVTSMFIASKYEEMYAPEVSDFVYITDNTYSKQEILRMERTMLKVLKFDLSRPLPLHFLRRNSKAGNVDATVHTLAKYFMEVVLTEYDCAHYRPSLLAAASLYLARKLLTEAPWTETLKFYSNYSEEQVMPIVKNLCKIIIKAETSKLKAVHSKYASSKLLKISTIPQLKSSVVIELANAQ